jgi:hypothetical protein
MFRVLFDIETLADAPSTRPDPTRAKFTKKVPDSMNFVNFAPQPPRDFCRNWAIALLRSACNGVGE